MANATATSYLKLPFIALGNTNLINQYNDTLRKMDIVGKHLRLQKAAGDSMAIRAELSNGTLVDAIRIVPDQNSDSIAIYLGRAGKSDRIVIESSSLYTSVYLANQNATAPDKNCSLGATWADEDGVAGDSVQDCAVLVDTRNNLKTTVIFPPARAVTNTNPYLGSALQLQADPSGVGTDTPFLKFICESTTGTKTYLVPVFTL